MKPIFPGVLRENQKLFTKGKSKEYWDPYSSKPAAAIMKGLNNFPVKEGQTILYLGAAHGTTISHFSNIVGEKGRIYGVEVSEKVIPDLLKKARAKQNIIPLVEDARFPENYGWIGPVDLVYEDIAQKDQVAILKRNAQMFLKEGGIVVLALKAKAIDSVRSVKEICQEAVREMEDTFEIIETVELDPYERDHLFIVAKLK
ncbi:MAG: fibrillarin-like rRNA/tRNA 2'-O-methyltransferase [Candidatus Aenigmarchaeota archaeon]|nr:fibrillarin-like rRNA/tRNA 2'-O-methyltransferase [Candidatus Aenigmarchaeota archaeon]